MKPLLKFCLVMLLFLFSKMGFSQNVMINVLTLNSGIVKKKSTIFFEVTLSNTSPIKKVTSYKLRPQISFPDDLVEIPDSGHILPKGWVVLSNNKGVILLSNGTDEIPENENRTILIAVKGKTIGGPSAVLGNLTFSNGFAPGSVIGHALSGDNPLDNSSSSAIKVIK